MSGSKKKNLKATCMSELSVYMRLNLYALKSLWVIFVTCHIKRSWHTRKGYGGEERRLEYLNSEE